ncbi:unnamed protein product [Cuscuta campestris]|uniref:Uncharacterized protein n=1 Tax=Cuscuta campestris TaxID=132261 RepID=A0A484NI85_9ASTE|nr:unnamed protein product [Cuscuta campestris]
MMSPRQMPLVEAAVVLNPVGFDTESRSRPHLIAPRVKHLHNFTVLVGVSIPSRKLGLIIQAHKREGG